MTKQSILSEPEVSRGWRNHTHADCFVSQVFELHLFEGEASPDWLWWADAVRLVGGRTPTMVQFWSPWILVSMGTICSYGQWSLYPA